MTLYVWRLAQTFFFLQDYENCVTMTNFYVFFSYDQAMEGAKMAGASRIIGVDLNPAKYEQGKICLMGTQGHLSKCCLIAH